MYADNIMHFQEGNGGYWMVNEDSGEIIDSLQTENTLFRNYDESHLLGFSYESNQLGETSSYNYALEIRLWNSIANTFSKSFRFDFGQDYPYEPTVYMDLVLIFIVKMT
jgi:hypothetical protein